MKKPKKKAVLKHHSEQPFFNIVVGLAPQEHHRTSQFLRQGYRQPWGISSASTKILCYDYMMF